MRVRNLSVVDMRVTPFNRKKKIVFHTDHAACKLRFSLSSRELRVFLITKIRIDG